MFERHDVRKQNCCCCWRAPIRTSISLPMWKAIAAKADKNDKTDAETSIGALKTPQVRITIVLISFGQPSVI